MTRTYAGNSWNSYEFHRWIAGIDPVLSSLLSTRVPVLFIASGAAHAAAGYRAAASQPVGGGRVSPGLEPGPLSILRERS